MTPVSIKVKVLGGVKTPGLLELPVNTPLSQAVYYAGGPNDYVAQKKAQLIRLNKDGSVSNKKYKLRKDLPTSKEFNPLLKNNDIVYIPPSTFGTTSGILSTVVSPLKDTITILAFLKLL